MNKNVLITGGNGLIGKYLSARLSSAGYTIFILTRAIDKKCRFHQYLWNINKNEIDTGAVKNMDYIIHLAGVNVGEKRWNTKRKQQIIDSRVKSSDLILKALNEADQKPKAIISASAIGYYGSDTSEKICKEDDPPGNDFLSSVCRQWEHAVDQFNESGVRVVKIRTGIVLSKQGGALQKLLLPVKLGIGSAIGNGSQFMPWIHIEDLCNIYLKAIEDNQMKGNYNAVAPEHITNREFVKLLSKTLKKPFWFPNIPSFFLKLLFGEMSQILLSGNRVSSKKISDLNFIFKYPSLQGAFNNLLIE